MAEAAAGFLEQLKSCIVWSWTYLWTVWFFIVLFLVYILRVPLRINDNLSTGQARARPPLPRPGKLVQVARSGSRPAGARARAGTRRFRSRPEPRGLGGPSVPRGGRRATTPRARVSGRPLAGPRRAPRAPELHPGLERPNCCDRRPAPRCAEKAHAWPGLRAHAPPGREWSLGPRGVAVRWIGRACL